MGERRKAPGGLLVLALFTVLMGVQLPAAVGAGSPASLRGKASEMRSQHGALTTEAQSAWLTIVSLDTRLEQTRAALIRLRARTQAVAREREEANLLLGIARRGLRGSERRLASRLRFLYEQGDTDPLAVVLGAASLGEAIEGLESLDRMAGQDKRHILQAKRARTKFLRLSRTLAAREAEARRAEDAAAATAAALAAARADRAAMLAQLRVQQRRTLAKASALDTQARSLAANQSAAPAASAQPMPSAPVAGGRVLTVLATGYALPGKTATGVSVGWGVVAVDPSVIPLGTRMTIPGYGAGVAADTGGAVRGAHIDLWFPTTAEALRWGTRTVTITLH